MSRDAEMHKARVERETLTILHTSDQFQWFLQRVEHMIDVTAGRITSREASENEWRQGVGAISAYRRVVSLVEHELGQVNAKIEGMGGKL